MTFNLPPRARVILYALTALGTPVIAYLFAKDILGELEVVLWGAEVTVVTTMAGLNVSNQEKK